MLLTSSGPTQLIFRNGGQRLLGTSRLTLVHTSEEKNAEIKNNLNHQKRARSSYTPTTSVTDITKLGSNTK